MRRSRLAAAVLTPLATLLVALLAASVVVLAAGASPRQAFATLVAGALGSSDAVGYTLHYAANFCFTGLAVALAARGGLFNIGAEGQATLGSLGAGLAALAFDRVLPAWLLLPLAMLAAMAFGAAWAAVPAVLQAYRGSHIVITTILFNFIASALLVYLLVNVLIAPDTMAPESRTFAESAWIPAVHEVAAKLGLGLAGSPLNLAAVLAPVACLAVGIAVARTPWGYGLRALGHSPDAAVYAGVDPKRVTIQALCLSGALAGLVGVNEVLGVQHRLILNVSGGYGFTGIAVALMGRNHPVGIVLASLLFGVLYQGGAELAFDIPQMTRDMVVVMQGFVILFAGAFAGAGAWGGAWRGRRILARTAPFLDPARQA
jgi:general nucleoside transport system permease protein